MRGAPKTFSEGTPARGTYFGCRGGYFLGWRRSLGNRRRGGRHGKIALGGARTRNPCRTTIEFSRQRVRAQTELHQRFGFRQSRSGKPMLRLIAQHGVMGARIPLAARITLKVTLTNQRLLNFLYALGLQVKARPALLTGQRARPPLCRIPMARGGALVLGSVSRCVIWRPFYARCRGRVRGGFSPGGIR